jgi:hypothetical protein
VLALSHFGVIYYIIIKGESGRPLPAAAGPRRAAPATGHAPKRRHSPSSRPVALPTRTCPRRRLRAVQGLPCDLVPCYVPSRCASFRHLLSGVRPPLGLWTATRLAGSGSSPVALAGSVSGNVSGGSERWPDHRLAASSVACCRFSERLPLTRRLFAALGLSLRLRVSLRNPTSLEHRALRSCTERLAAARPRTPSLLSSALPLPGPATMS